MLGLPLDHVAIAVPSIEAAARIHERLTGTPSSPIETLEKEGVRVAFLGALELIEPTRPDSPVGRFLDRRGSALHHIAYRTPDVAAELARLTAQGFEPIDREPRVGARGHRVAFLHPKGTGSVLVELVEHAE